MIGTYNSQKLYDYCEGHSDKHSVLLGDLYRETHLKVMRPRMASGPLQGRILSFLSQMIQPSYILEVGTFTGYATLCLAEGLAQDGKIVTIEVNPEYAYISDKYFSKSPWSEQITPMIGDAIDLLPTVDSGIDMVFVDARKRDYQRYYDLIIDKVNAGGVLLVDNILWDGKVLEENKDVTTETIHSFNEYIKKDDRVSNVILPLRDGVNIIIKR